MTMYEDDLEKVIKDDLYREAEVIQKKVNASGAEEISDALKKDIRSKLQGRIDAYEEEQAYAGLSEKDREALRLGRRLQEKRSAASDVHTKRRRRIYAAAVAAVVLVFTVGMTSMGGAEKIASVIEQAVGERKVVKVNSDEGNKVLENEDEKEAYQKIKDVFGTEAVRIANQNKDMEFVQMNIDDNLQVAEMLYQYGDNNFWYIISAGYYDSSFGFDVEDKIIDEEEIKVNGHSIELTTYQLEESKEVRCLARFTYQKLEYILLGGMDKENFISILKKLYFL